MSEKKCVFAGTFDPPTLGHKYVIESALQVFDEVIVGILNNPKKTPYFTVEQRREMLVRTVSDPRVRIVEFTGTVAELMQKEHARCYVRGLRNATDFDYETSDFYASKKLNGEMLAWYLPCPQELLHVSSSIVRNSLQFSTPIDEYVTPSVQAYIREIKK